MTHRRRRHAAPLSMWHVAPRWARWRRECRAAAQRSSLAGGGADCAQLLRRGGLHEVQQHVSGGVTPTELEAEALEVRHNRGLRYATPRMAIAKTNDQSNLSD